MRKTALSIQLLNHASVLIRKGEFSLLSDPWFQGTCFHRGWGLRYLNPDAYSEAATASHLWISRFHEAHLHLPTLKEIYRLNPKMKVLANRSFNFDLSKPLRKIGFKDVIPLPERKRVVISEQCQMIRYPSAGVDNILFLELNEMRILNLNDCNMSLSAIQAFLKKIGPIDLLFCNFNHANKLSGLISKKTMNEELKERFKRIVDAVHPKWVIPFSSMHYYRSIDAFHQNESMLMLDEIAKVDSRVVSLLVGDEVEFMVNQEPRVHQRKPALIPVEMTQKEYQVSLSWKEVLNLSEVFYQRLKKGFFGIIRWIPSTRLYIKDLDRILVIDPLRGVSESQLKQRQAHISIHSEMLKEWFGQLSGTAALFISGDFQFINPDQKPIRRLILAGKFLDNGLNPRQVLKMLFKKEGWQFFWNRREEIWALLLEQSFQRESRI